MANRREPIFKVSGVASQLSIVTPATSRTVAATFIVTTGNIICTGVRFYWSVSTSKTVKVSLWDSGTTRLANVSVTVATTGVYEGIFATPQTLTKGSIYRVSAWQTDGANYTAATSNSSTTSFIPIRPYFAGHGVSVSFLTDEGAGDAAPTSNDGTVINLLEPIF